MKKIKLIIIACFVLVLSSLPLSSCSSEETNTEETKKTTQADSEDEDDSGVGIPYFEKSRIGRDINALDSVRLGIEAEIMDERLSSITTGTTSIGTGENATTKIKGIFLSDIFNKKANDEFDMLSARLFGDAMILDESFVDGSVFESKTAKNADAKIAVFIDGNGGVAVAIVSAQGELLTYEEDKLIVMTKLSLEDLEFPVRSLN